MTGAGRFVGRVALVTGGGSGIGRAIASRLGSEGACIVVLDRGDAAETAARELAAEGVTALGMAGDVTRRDEVDRTVADAVGTLGRIDVLIASAGVSRPAPLLEMDDETWSSVIAVNLTGAFLCVQAVGRHMAERGGGGRMVLIASNCAQRAAPDRANYNASKGGVVSLMQSAAVELARYGIAVNALSPGPVDSPMSRRNHTLELRQSIITATPLRRYAETSEIAAAAAFLASNEADYLTGHELTVDGGAGAALYPSEGSRPA